MASANIATPIYIEPGELRGGVKGLPEYDRRSNFPSPWPGGWWRLRDIIDYELIATRAFLEAAATHRQSLLTNVYRMAREATERGAAEAPYAFVIPADQHDPVAAALLVDLMLRHGVRVQRAASPVDDRPRDLRRGHVRPPRGAALPAIPADHAPAAALPRGGPASLADRSCRPTT